jgi:mono/diheme cytochrome c family protein
MIILFKIIIASLLFLAGLAAAGSMLRLIGKTPPSTQPARLRLIHAWSGYIFAGGLVLNTVLGLILLTRAGDSLPLRAVLHWHLALALDVLILLKILVVKVFRQMLARVSGLGLAASGLALIVLAGSLLFAALPGPPADAAAPAGAEASAIGLGRDVFGGLCAGCHPADGADSRTAPGLAGLFRRATIPASGRPATEENVRLQLRRPFRAMPPFPALTETEIAGLLAFLRTL